MSEWCYELQIVVRQSLTGLEGSFKAVSLKSASMTDFKKKRYGRLSVEPAHGHQVTIKWTQNDPGVFQRVERAQRTPSEICTARWACEMSQATVDWNKPVFTA